MSRGHRCDSAAPAPGNRDGGVRCGLPLESLQVGTHLGRALVAHVAIFFERLVNDLDKFLAEAQEIAAVADGGCLFRIASKITAELLPVNGGRPVAIW